MKLSKLMMGAVCLIGAQLTALSAGEGWKDCNSPCHHTKAPRCFEMDTCDVQYHLYADYLYWEVLESDLNLGVDPVSGDTTYLNPKFDSGFRVGATAAWHKWDLGLRYTWLRNHSTGVLPDTLLTLAAPYRFELNVGDIEIGHSFCLDCGPAIFRPFVGAKLAWIKDNFDTSASVGGVSPGFVPSDTHMHFKGYGLYIGACGRWELYNYESCGWSFPLSLVVRGSTGLLRSNFKQTVTVAADTVTGTATTHLDRQDAYVPVHEGYVGLDASFNGFCDNEICLQVGYEAQYWGWRKHNDVTQTAHLGMGGLVVRAGFSF